MASALPRLTGLAMMSALWTQVLRFLSSPGQQPWGTLPAFASFTEELTDQGTGPMGGDLWSPVEQQSAINSAMSLKTHHKHAFVSTTVLQVSNCLETIFR